MRIIGAFSVTIMRTRLYVIIMTNVFEFAGMQKPLHQVFDLKVPICTPFMKYLYGKVTPDCREVGLIEEADQYPKLPVL